MLTDMFKRGYNYGRKCVPKYSCFVIVKTAIEVVVPAYFYLAFVVFILQNANDNGLSYFGSTGEECVSRAVFFCFYCV